MWRGKIIKYHKNQKKKGKLSHLRVEVDHGRCLDVLLPEHLHLHRRIGELVGEVIQEIWEVGRSSMNDSHHEARSLGLILAERQSHKLLSETLHLRWRETRELVTVGVRHRRPSISLLLDVDQVAELQAGHAWHWGAVERGAVAEPVPDRGGDGDRGSGSKSILVVVLRCCGGVEQAAAVHAVVPVDPAEELGQRQRHS